MSHETRTIGVVEDDPIMGESLQQALELEGFAVEWWQSGEAALAGLRRVRTDLVVCDIRLPDIGGPDVFRQASRCCAAPFLFMTAFADIDQAVALMRSGAGDYLTKPFDMASFLERARSLIARSRTEAEGILGASASMRQLEALLRRIADLPTPVLLMGETGVGKEVAARFLHGISPARNLPFMAVNCAAIPSELIESELFGHERGAFTGASGRHLGYAERAGGGFLFLDEIGDLPLAAQSKLLHLLENRTFLRVGGERPIPFKARVVSATNRDLQKGMAAGRFREDLLFRINALAVEVAPLRERPEDVSWLAERFFEMFCDAMNRDLRGISVLAEEAALAYPWPGNVRELRNRVERAVALATGDWIMPHDLFPAGAHGAASVQRIPTLEEARLAAEKRLILRALSATGGEIIQSARMLGISRTTMWEKMRRFEIDGPQG